MGSLPALQSRVQAGDAAVYDRENAERPSTDVDGKGGLPENAYRTPKRKSLSIIT